MDPRKPRFSARHLAYGVLCLLFLGLCFFVYQTLTLKAEVETLHADIAVLGQEKTTLQSQYASSTAKLEEASSTIAVLSQELSLTSEELEELEDDYREERDRNEEFEEQIEEIAGTVGDLDKLSKTDEELLEKYSKVYFLNEHYVPSDLSVIEDQWEYTEREENKLHAKVMPFFEDMVEDAKADGIDLWVVSSYRSFAEQGYLKGRYTTIYGSGANTFSADQGFSEHQLGTTVDFTTSGIGGGLVTAFENTEAFAWLQEHAHEYGFTLSYPKDNAYYVYEPWHWRFVGEDLAEDLYEDDAYFYDWDQRKIDSYLIKIFD